MKLGHTGGLALVLGAVMATAGCGDPQATGLHVTVSFAGLSIDQIQFAITAAGGAAIVAQRPETSTAGTALASPQDVLVFLPDDAAGHPVSCQATGMARGTLTAATGAASTTLALHLLVPATITLQTAGPAPPPDRQEPPPPDKEQPPDGGQCPKDASALASSILPPSKARCK
jgi:hypothetical protein